MRDLKNPTTPQDAVDLAPLRESHEATQLEAELKALFMDMLGQYVRPQERETNTVGMPHLGPFVQVERAVKSEGLSLVRSSDDGAMRYLFRSWRANNPKRGLHMLRTYLQLLWPNEWTLNHMWSDIATTYPTTLLPIDGGNHFLTSRVEAHISTALTDGSDVQRTAASLRSVMPARMLLKISLSQKIPAEMSLASAMYAGAVIHRIEGTLDQPSDVDASSGLYLGASIEYFDGTLV